MWSPVPQEILEDTSLDTLVIRNKAMNECFHGTSHFQPGVYGYQQHMCYAALDREAVVFVNHPGETSDLSSMRPGYWYGQRPDARHEAGKELPGIYLSAQR